MATHMTNGGSIDQSSRSPLKLKWGRSVTFLFLFHGSVLFLSAGRLDWTMAWVYLAAFIACILAMGVYLERTKPELMAERAQLKPKEDVDTWDVRVSILIRLSLLLILVVSGLDQRFAWTGEFPLVVQILAILVGFSGYLLIMWALASNNFAAAYVRIQAERGHIVATSGPYRTVRHPFYVGVITFGLALPLVLGSLWALIPAGALATLFVVRTALEDQKLCAELDGYKAYAGQVRYRLLPGIW